MSELIDHQKRQTLLKLLDRGLVMLHLDPRRPGVVVPEQYAEDAVLRLNIAYGFNLPALDISLEGVYAVLSFQRRNFGCTLPWSAIFAMTLPEEGHEGVVWPEAMPPELDPFFGEGLEEVSGRARPVPSPKPRPAPAEARTRPPAASSTRPITPKTGPRAGLQVIEGGADPPPAGDGSGDDDTDGPPPSRPVLRVIKG